MQFRDSLPVIEVNVNGQGKFALNIRASLVEFGEQVVKLDGNLTVGRTTHSDLALPDGGLILTLTTRKDSNNAKDKDFTYCADYWLSVAVLTWHCKRTEKSGSTKEISY